MFNKFPKRTGIYHIKDEIEQLELKVTFRHINSLLKLPKFDYNKSMSPQWREEKREADSYGDGEITEVRIKWQEKLFSADEEKLYKDSSNCKTEIQKKYNDWLLKKEEAREQENNSKRRRRKKSKTKKQKPQREEVEDHKEGHEIHTYIDEDNFRPNKKHKEKDGNLGVEGILHMYIYAQIDVDTELVHLEWHAEERVLHIYPDFNSFDQNPYFIEIDKDYRHLYAYAIENISKSRPAPPGGDLSLYLELPELKPQWRTAEEEQQRAALFAMPPKRTKRVSMLLEIREARNFEYDAIHVRYHIHLPECTIHEEGPLHASTHSSSMSGDSGGVHHFGYNWQLTLLCEENFDPAQSLHIYFEVISIDSWERERVEGYAFLAVSLLKTSNVEMHRLQCLRPVDSYLTALERFFIGGRRKFDFVKFFGQQPTTNDDDESTEVHSRYGSRMKSTGTMEVSCQIFTQRNCELLEPCPNRRSGMTLDDIMLAYRGARRRLERLALK